MMIEHVKHCYFYVLLFVFVFGGSKCEYGCLCVFGYMCMWNCMCSIYEPVFGGLKLTSCVFFDDSYSH